MRIGASIIAGAALIAGSLMATAPTASAHHLIPTYTHTTTNSPDFHRTTNRADYYSIRVRVSGAIRGRAALYLDGDLQRIRDLRDGIIVFHVYRSDLRNHHETTLTVKIFPRSDRREDRVIRRSVTDRPEGDAIVTVAKAQVGDRYVNGGNGPSAWDCSGLVGYAVETITGKNLPRTSGAIKNAGHRVSSARPGDVLWTPGHVSIYAGHGKVVEAANPTTDVVYRNVWQRNPVVLRF